MKNRFESETQFLERLIEVAPFANQAEAARAARALLQVIGGLLDQGERAAFARELPVELAKVLGFGLPQPRLEWDEFHRRVAELAGVPLGLSIEQSEVVCGVLSETLTPATRRHLQMALPGLASLFELSEETEPPLGESHRSSAAPNDLAEGRPGGSSPIATADPSALAHRHSVARSEDPHGSTKVSSAHGLRQEQTGRTLADGRPGSERPLSSSR